MTVSPGHPSVCHPYDGSEDRRRGLHDRFLGWMTERVLASVIMFDVALVSPLLVLPMSSNAKLILAVISSNWIQWWALPALQRSQIQADAKRIAKADADHVALTHIASTLDEVKAMLASNQEEVET